MIALGKDLLRILFNLFNKSFIEFFLEMKRKKGSEYQLEYQRNSGIMYILSSKPKCSHQKIINPEFLQKAEPETRVCMQFVKESDVKKRSRELK